MGKTPDDITYLFVTEDVFSLKVTIPDDCLITCRLCEKLTNKILDENKELQDIFVPEFDKKPINPEDIQTDIGRGDLMRVFAQFECALYKKEEN